MSVHIDDCDVIHTLVEQALQRNTLGLDSTVQRLSRDGLHLLSDVVELLDGVLYVELDERHMAKQREGWSAELSDFLEATPSETEVA